MAIQQTNSKRETVLNLSGDLTIVHGDEVLSQLRDALENYDEIRISLQGADAVDLSLVQILCSAHRTAAVEKKKIRLERPIPDIFRQAVINSGLKRRSGCSYSKDVKCLCNDGENDDKAHHDCG